MKSFEYAAPKTLKDATALLGEKWGETEILAGGTDLVTSLKQHITAPNRVVSLKNISELKGITTDGKGIRVGATTTLAELAEHKDIKQHFPSLVTAINGIGSLQITSVGTVGGDLCQRPRCWYYRNGFGLLARVTQKRTEPLSPPANAIATVENFQSLVREGDNRYHAIFGNEGPAYFVSPSSLGPALIALGATVTAVGPKVETRKIAASDFFKTPKNEDERETALKPNEILTEILIPIAGLKNATYEVRHRHGLDWPYVTASVAFQLKNGSASDGRIVLGHVAPMPWLASSAAKALSGKIDEASASKCAQAATTGAKPLSGNAYKVQLVKTAVKRAVLAAAAA